MGDKSHGTTDVAALYMEIHRLQDEVKRLTSMDAARIRQLHEAHEEARQVRSELRLGSRMVKIALRAEVDVMNIIKIYLAGMATTRENCENNLLLSRRRWNWARQLARSAGIHDGREYRLVQRNDDGEMEMNIEKSLERLHGHTEYIIRNKRWDLLRENVPR